MTTRIVCPYDRVQEGRESPPNLLRGMLRAAKDIRGPTMPVTPVIHPKNYKDVRICLGEFNHQVRMTSEKLAQDRSLDFYDLIIDV